MTRQSWTAVISTVLFVVLIAGIALAPVPFVIREPGQAVTLVGQGEGDPKVSVIGATTYAHPESGQIIIPRANMTGQRETVSFPEAWIGYLRGDIQVIRREVVYPLSSQNIQSQVDEAGSLTTSQSNAVVAALSQASIPVVPRPIVTQVSSAGPSYGRVEVGDILVSINDTAVDHSAEAIQMVQQMDPGSILRLKILRENVEFTVEVTLVSTQDPPHVSTLGLDIRDSYQHGVDVSFDADMGTDPDAGLAIALGLYDQLVPTSVIAGRRIAAVGQVSAQGEVSSVGSVRQLVGSAQEGGAEILLLPSNNCGDIEELDYSILVVRVTKLSDAITSLELLKDPQAADQVPRC